MLLRSYEVLQCLIFGVFKKRENFLLNLIGNKFWNNFFGGWCTWSKKFDSLSSSLEGVKKFNGRVPTKSFSGFFRADMRTLDWYSARSFCLSVCLCMCLSVYVSNTSFYLSLYTNRSFVLSFCLCMSPILPFIISLFTPWMISYLTLSRTHTLSCYYAGTAYSFFLSVDVSNTS